MARRKIIPIFIPQGGCKNQCLFCNQRGITGVQSFPTVAALAQSFPRGGKDYELAYYGGSFTSLPFDVLHSYLDFAKNLKAAGRIGRLRISTHPTSLSSEIIGLLKAFGVDTIELGVQSLDDEVLHRAGRDHGRREILHSLFQVKNNGFELGVQLMVGLPLDTPEKVFRSIEEILPFAPAMVRIYPLLVLGDTPLAREFLAGDYEPMSLTTAVTLVRDMYAVFSYYQIPVIRMGLQPTALLNRESKLLLAGPFHPAFGHLVKAALKRKQVEMILRAAPKKCRLVVTKEDLPLLYGEGGESLKDLRVKYELAVSGTGTVPGSVGVAPYEKSRRGEILAFLTAEEFYGKYLNENVFWSKSCI